MELSVKKISKNDKAGFIPADVVSAEKMKKLKDGAEYIISTKRPRKTNIHNQSFAILQLLYDNWRDEPVENIRIFRQVINIIIGNYDIIMYKGEIQKITRSWSYNDMDNDEFIKSVYNPLIEFACQYLDMERDILINASIETANFRDHF